MTELDYEDIDSEIDGNEDTDKEAKYQELVSGWELELDVFTEEENLLTIDDYVDGFTALGDYKDSAKKAEECRRRREELKKMFPPKEAEAPPKPKSPSFEDKYEALKSQIETLEKSVKNDEEKVASLRGELSEIIKQEPEKALRQKKRNKVAIPLSSIFCILCFIVGGILIGIEKMETIISGVVCEFLSFSLLIVMALLWDSDRKIDVDAVKRTLVRKNELSSALDAASKTAEEHRNELQEKREELSRYLLGL